MSGRLRRYEISERSMEPALRPGDYVLANRSAWPFRGDVVVIDHPRRDGFELVKRVIGLPGETVTVTDGRVLIDGAPLPEPWAVGTTQPDGEWELTDREMFVLGDQRDRSAADSRTVGPIIVPYPTWTVAFRYWPPRRIDIV